MSKRFILLLVSVALVASATTIVVMGRHRKSAASNVHAGSASPPTTPKKPSSPSSASSYAYATATDFVLMRGTQEVVRVKRSFDNEDSDNNQVAWTLDSRYAAFLSRSVDSGHTDTDNTPRQLDVVNATTGAVSNYSCPDCDTLVAVGSDTVLTLSRSDQGYQMHSFDLASSKPGTPVDMSGLQHPEAYNALLAGAAGQVLVEYQYANGGLDGNSIYLMKANGSSDAYSQEIPDGGRAVFSAAAEQTAYNQAEMAVVLRDYRGDKHGQCLNTDSVQLISASGNEVNADMGTAHPLTDGATIRNGVIVDDLWWGSDGHLHATMSAKTCSASGDPLSAAPDSLYRLDGTHWVQEDPNPVTMERTFSAGAKAVLIEQDCRADKSVAAIYCNTGPLYFEQSGKRALVADHVILISTPPPSKTSSSG